MSVEQFINQSEISSYLKDLRKTEPIPQEKELELGLKAKSGDQKAREQLIKANLRFVLSVAKKYQQNGIELADLISEGNLGLCKAIEKFDWESGNKFITYAVYWIRQSIIQYLNEHSRIIRIPVNRINDLQSKKKEIIYDEYQEVDLSEEIIVSSLHSFISEEDELLSVIEDPSAVIPGKDIDPPIKDKLLSILEKLPEREKRIIEMYYGLDGTELTLEEVGKVVGLSKERVRQLKEKALRKIRFYAKELFI